MRKRSEKVDTVMASKYRSTGIYVTAFASALGAYIVAGFIDPPESGGEWTSFILWGIGVAIVAAAILGSLITFRGRLSLKRTKQRHTGNGGQG